MIKVLIADDHAIMRRGLKEILAEIPDLMPAGEAATGAEALRAVRENVYDIVLLDIALPDLNGLEVLKQMRQLAPQTRVLMLSVYPEEEYALRALKAGAAGYLTKDSAPAELTDAIRLVSQGGRYVSQVLAQQLAGMLSGQEATLSHHQLSDREYQVLKLLGAGKTVTLIAAELALSDRTITTYRVRILQKLGLKTTAELIRYAVEHGLVD